MNTWRGRACWHTRRTHWHYSSRTDPRTRFGFWRNSKHRQKTSIVIILNWFAASAFRRRYGLGLLCLVPIDIFDSPDSTGPRSWTTSWPPSLPWTRSEVPKQDPLQRQYSYSSASDSERPVSLTADEFSKLLYLLCNDFVIDVVPTIMNVWPRSSKLSSSSSPLSSGASKERRRFDWVSIFRCRRSELFVIRRFRLCASFQQGSEHNLFCCRVLRTRWMALQICWSRLERPRLSFLHHQRHWNHRSQSEAQTLVWKHVITRFLIIPN